MACGAPTLTTALSSLGEVDGRRRAHAQRARSRAVCARARALGVRRGAARRATPSRSRARAGFHLGALRRADSRLLSTGARHGAWMKQLWTRAAATLGGLEARYRVRSLGPFEPTRWVWSRGLGLSCDHNGGLLFVRGQRGSRAPLRFNPADFEQVRDGDLVWTRLTALPQFVREALPRIRAKFALLTGDEDWSIPKSFAASAELLDNPRLVYWFSQNVDGSARTPSCSRCRSASIFTPSAMARAGATRKPRPPRKRPSSISCARRCRRRGTLAVGARRLSLQQAQAADVGRRSPRRAASAGREPQRGLPGIEAEAHRAVARENTLRLRGQPAR